MAEPYQFKTRDWSDATEDDDDEAMDDLLASMQKSNNVAPVDFSQSCNSNDDDLFSPPGKFLVRLQQPPDIRYGFGTRLSPLQEEDEDEEEDQEDNCAPTTMEQPNSEESPPWVKFTQEFQEQFSFVKELYSGVVYPLEGLSEESEDEDDELEKYISNFKNTTEDPVTTIAADEHTLPLPSSSPEAQALEHKSVHFDLDLPLIRGEDDCDDFDEADHINDILRSAHTRPATPYHYILSDGSSESEDDSELKQKKLDATTTWLTDTHTSANSIILIDDDVLEDISTYINRPDSPISYTPPNSNLQMKDLLKDLETYIQSPDSPSEYTTEENRNETRLTLSGSKQKSILEDLGSFVNDSDSPQIEVYSNVEILAPIPIRIASLSTLEANILSYQDPDVCIEQTENNDIAAEAIVHTPNVYKRPQAIYPELSVNGICPTEDDLYAATPKPPAKALNEDLYESDQPIIADHIQYTPGNPDDGLVFSEASLSSSSMPGDSSSREVSNTTSNLTSVMTSSIFEGKRRVASIRNFSNVSWNAFEENETEEWKGDWLSFDRSFSEGQYPRTPALQNITQNHSSKGKQPMRSGNEEITDDSYESDLQRLHDMSERRQMSGEFHMDTLEVSLAMLNLRKRGILSRMRRITRTLSGEYPEDDQTNEEGLDSVLMGHSEIAAESMANNEEPKEEDDADINDSDIEWPGLAEDDDSFYHSCDGTVIITNLIEDTSLPRDTHPPKLSKRARIKNALKKSFHKASEKIADKARRLTKRKPRDTPSQSSHPPSTEVPRRRGPYMRKDIITPEDYEKYGYNPDRVIWY